MAGAGEGEEVCVVAFRVLAAFDSTGCLGGAGAERRIQYSDRALERLLARDVPSADVTAKDAAVCQSAPTTHPHNVPGILVSSFFSFFFFPLHSVEATVIIFVTFHVFPLPSIMFFSREVLLTIIL